MSRRPRAVAAVLLALAGGLGSVGCGGGDTVSDGDLAKLRELDHGPLYWAGREAGGLPLARADSRRPGMAFFAYGDCDPGGAWPSIDPGGCAPPIQIQQFPFEPASWGDAYECERLPPVQNVPAARHDGLVLFSGTSVVKIYARSRAEDMRIALALRTLDGGALPPPPPHVVEAVERACGTT